MKTEIVALLDKVSRSYGTPPTDALKEVSLSVRRGDFLAIVGPSGSGKSTLLNIMGTLDRPSNGEVYIDGSALSGYSDTELSTLRAHSIGFIFQQFHLQDGLTAVDNVADGLLYTGLPREKRQQQAVRALMAVRLGHRLRHKPRQMSGGERQRVAIARAVAGKPSFILADEPTGNLDSVSGNVVIATLQELNRKGATVVMITHDLTLAAKASRQVSIKDGVIQSIEPIV